VPVRQRKEVQKMSRSCCLALGIALVGAHLFAADRIAPGSAFQGATSADPATFPEYGVVHAATASSGNLSYRYWRSKDLTGALGLWEALRRPGDKPCAAAPFCTLTQAGGVQTVVLDDNYVIAFTGKPNAAEVNGVLAALPVKKETSLPAILTFLPRTGLVPGSARYLLGDASLEAYAP